MTERSYGYNFCIISSVVEVDSGMIRNLCIGSSKWVSACQYQTTNDKQIRQYFSGPFALALPHLFSEARFRRRLVITKLE